jgi:pimeloyl-ACP methyl ester carboxylesterase
VTAAAAASAEQASGPGRALYPDETGYVERDGVRVFWERYGDGEPAVLFVPPWSLVHSRCWKLQLPYFARHGCALTFDPRGNGRSDRPSDPSAYDETAFAADALAVLDAAGIERSALVSLSRGAQRALLLATGYPERVSAACFIAPSVSLTSKPGARAAAEAAFDARHRAHHGWAKFNRHYWRRNQRGFAEFFFAQVFPERHSTKQIEDGVGWALETDPDALIASELATGIATREEAQALCVRVRCPVLVIVGAEDRVTGTASGRALAESTGGELMVMNGAGHLPMARFPVAINIALRAFLASAGAADVQAQ